MKENIQEGPSSVCCVCKQGQQEYSTDATGILQNKNTWLGCFCSRYSYKQTSQTLTLKVTDIHTDLLTDISINNYFASL